MYQKAAPVAVASVLMTPALTVRRSWCKNEHWGLPERHTVDNSSETSFMAEAFQA